MARVCEDWFPKGTYSGQAADGFWMDDYLKQNIDVLVKNVTKDWDFVILISGQGEMRIGKSLLAMQIGAYWTYQVEKIHGIKVPFEVKRNFVMHGGELMEKGDKLGTESKYGALIQDEAADDLESTKVLTKTTQAVKDWLRKAAQYNMLNLIVQSEFFEVPKPIAVSRSIYLLDVHYEIDSEGNFKRGKFNFYSRRKKKLLYLKGKKNLDYNVIRPNFKGTFINFYPIDEQEYREAKAESLKKWKQATAAEIRWRQWVEATMKVMYQEQGLSYREIADKISKLSKTKISHETVGKLIKGEKYVDEDEKLS